MHNAPSVNYPVGRCRFFAALLLVVALAALALQVGWAASVTEPPRIQRWAGWVGFGFWLMWGVWATWYWRQSPQGQLAWDAHAPSASPRPDGERGAWRWQDASSPEATPLGAVGLALDLQSLALLRLPRAELQSRWIWVERWRDPVRWNDLRRALYSTGA